MSNIDSIVPKLQEHLVWALKKQQQYYNEIQQLTAEISQKRDLLMKYQGIVEYLRDTQGIKVPENKSTEKESELSDG